MTCTAPRSRRLGVLAALGLLWLVLASAEPALGGESTPPGIGRITQATDFPAPIVAPVLTPPDIPPPLALTSFEVTESTDATVATLRFAGPFEGPLAEPYRASVHLGDPTADHLRISLVTEGGEPRGTVQVGRGTDWETTGETAVTVSPDGLIDLDLPSEQIGDDDSIWIELGTGEVTFTSPLFVFADVVGRTPATQSVSPRAWPTAGGQPPGPAVSTGEPPSITVEDGQAIVTFPGPPPDEIDGTPVARAVDIVRFAPDYSLLGEAPYFVAVDHTAETVTLLDGTAPIPTEVAADTPWLVAGLPEGGVGPDTTIVLDLDAVLEAFGLDGSPDEIALGPARSLTLDDERVVRAEGPLATRTWFATEAEDPVSPSTAADSVPPITETDAASDRLAVTPSVEEDGDDGPAIWPIAIGAVLLAAALIGGWTLVRRRHRQTEMMMGPVIDRPATTTSLTEDDLDQLEQRLEELFGDTAETSRSENLEDAAQPVDADEDDAGTGQARLDDRG